MAERKTCSNQVAKESLQLNIITKSIVLLSAVVKHSINELKNKVRKKRITDDCESW